jgi:hypothetical protein
VISAQADGLVWPRASAFRSCRGENRVSEHSCSTLNSAHPPSPTHPLAPPGKKIKTPSQDCVGRHGCSVWLCRSHPAGLGVYCDQCGLLGLIRSRNRIQPAGFRVVCVCCKLCCPLSLSSDHLFPTKDQTAQTQEPTQGSRQTRPYTLLGLKHCTCAPAVHARPAPSMSGL